MVPYFMGIRPRSLFLHQWVKWLYRQLDFIIILTNHTVADQTVQHTLTKKLDYIWRWLLDSPYLG